MFSWGIVLMAIGGLSFLLPIFGRQFIIVSALGLTGMGSALAGIVLFVIGLVLFNAARKQESEEKSSRIAAVVAGRAANAVPESRANVRASPEAEERVSVADWFCHLTLNSPDEDYFNRMLSMIPEGASETEKARLRVCLCVTHAGLFLWYFDQMVNALGPDLPRSYREALRSESAKNALEVCIEDYVIDPNELKVYIAKHADRGVVEAMDAGKHSVHISDLIDGLISIRADGIRATVQADLNQSGEGFQVPFMKTSNLVVTQFAGRDPSALSYGGVLAAMIGQELAATISAVSKVLLAPSGNAGRS